MTAPLGYDAAVAESMDMRRRAQQADQAADHYHLRAANADEENRILTNEVHTHRSHYPHAHVDHRDDGWHASIDTWDNATGLHHTEKVFLSSGQAWSWLERTWAVIA